ncbi:nucleotidyltransferase [Neobacillus mesonae]|uniref:nucleotidyltransferase n=1 Tax=Neobacillus mesonae TaxID=1193713 RepID=UPI00203CBDDB|nr:nucleotidyltransferase [Neobacillus mesonae]MCM3568791.1 nucleotidyltransferase [Neobacillus mesonae]
MKSVGLVVEYNPFHNGHAFHLQASKKKAEADVVIAVMSGNFLQRGEPALVSKWYRTQMALLNGVDIVFELPYCFAVQKAETFANGAVSILNAAGCNSLCFGSESGEISDFLETIAYLKDQHKVFNENIKHFMETGLSYPKAIALAFQQLPNSEKYLDLSKPNNILGFQYIQAMQEHGSTMKPLTVARKNADYHDEHFASETIASATSIRKAIFSKEKENVNIGQYVPGPTNMLLQEYQHRFGRFHCWEDYWDLLQYRLITSSPEELQNVYEIEEGLENRLIEAAHTSTNFQDFMSQMKTKRYTWTRLQRLSVHVLTNSKKTEMKSLSGNAAYLRLLGMTSTGKEYLNKMKKHFSLPLVAKLSAYKNSDILPDIKAARVYAMAFPKNIRKEMLLQEFKQPPIFIPS